MLSDNKKKAAVTLLLCILVSIILGIGIFFLKDRRYTFVVLLICILGCIPFLLSFEKGQSKTRRILVLAVLIALSAAGRFLFAFLPGFKPVTAIVIISGMCFGPEAGFLTGSMTALISNIYFGQGPWTPFQMFVWGLIGVLAGLISMRGLLKKPAVLYSFGALSGLLYSLLMDVWSVLEVDASFTFSRYTATVLASLPMTVTYMVSNVIFLLLLAKPVCKKIERLKTKYDI